jgi:hypothetical protein
MSQQVAWRCSGCEEVVTAPVRPGWVSPDCPNCGQPKAATEAATLPAADASDARGEATFAATAGPQVDRALALRVLGGETPASVPPYSSEDWAATALAELVGRQSAWSFHLTFCGSSWTATFTEKTSTSNDPWSSEVSAFVCASGRTRALAICRAIWKVTRSPRWTPLAEKLMASFPAARHREGRPILPS